MDENDEEKCSVYTREWEGRNVKAEEMFIHELYMEMSHLVLVDQSSSEDQSSIVKCCSCVVEKLISDFELGI